LNNVKGWFLYIRRDILYLGRDPIAQRRVLSLEKGKNKVNEGFL